MLSLGHYFDIISQCAKKWNLAIYTLCTRHCAKRLVYTIVTQGPYTQMWAIIREDGSLCYKSK